VTPLGYKHLGIVAPRREPVQSTFFDASHDPLIDPPAGG
jgi:hypothetical protein